ncbi:hypothetical protein PHMEG_00031009 [Phytophthora megakarya]|uniref:Uncharacterized protein n=1 Tax=Phytophthora megakarya TaxID=4795 RepID=A0A225UZM2_9STRA|nr:hypothetical protein PHMEG_00031009 [Phytophthora megakarya]
MCTPPNGMVGSCLYCRSALSSFNHSDLDIMETSSMTRRSSGMKCLFRTACFSLIMKLARVRPPISVAALPVRAAFSTASSRCQLALKAWMASITRLLPVPPAPPRLFSANTIISVATMGTTTNSVFGIDATELLVEVTLEQRSCNASECDVLPMV